MANCMKVYDLVDSLCSHFSLPAKPKPAVVNLNSIQARLDELCNKVMSSGDGGNAPSVLDYDLYVQQYVKPFADTSQQIGLGSVSQMTDNAFICLRKVVVAALACKSPTPQRLQAYVEPIVSVCTKADEMKDKASPLFNHQAAFSEAITCMNFIFSKTPMSIIDGQIQSADFYLNAILRKFKDDKAKDSHRAFVKNLKQMLNELIQYVKQYHRTGIQWVGKNEL